MACSSASVSLGHSFSTPRRYTLPCYSKTRMRLSCFAWGMLRTLNSSTRRCMRSMKQSTRRVAFTKISLQHHERRRRFFVVVVVDALRPFKFTTTTPANLCNARVTTAHNIVAVVVKGRGDAMSFETALDNCRKASVHRVRVCLRSRHERTLHELPDARVAVSSERVCASH